MKDHFTIINDHYQPRLDEYSDSTDILDWEDEYSHYLRFKITEPYLDFTSKKILDVGCGLGDFYVWLKSKYSLFEYTGTDILPSMVQKAQSYHPETNFVLADAFDESSFPEKSFDIVFCSGIFNLNLGNNYEFMQKAITSFLRLAKGSIFINFLHQRINNKYGDKYFYYDPDKVLNFVPNTVQKILVLDNYLESDCSLFINI